MLVLHLWIVLPVCAAIVEVVLEILGDLMGVMQAACSQLVPQGRCRVVSPVRYVKLRLAQPLWEHPVLRDNRRHLICCGLRDHGLRRVRYVIVRREGVAADYTTLPVVQIRRARV